MKKFPTLYKRASTGAPQMWTITVDGNSFYTEAGQVGGVITTSTPTICEGKNQGRTNETSPEQQALAEATSKHQKKLDTGYFLKLEDIDNEMAYFKPMLAHKYLDYKDDLVFPLVVSQKLDGLRMIATIDGLTTRNGKPFNSCPHISKLLRPVFDAHPDWIIDGEIYSTEVPFEKIVSLTRKKNPSTKDLEESEEICQLWIFDGVVDKVDESFTDRFNLIQSEIEKIVGPSKSIKFVQNYLVVNHTEIEQKHDEFVRDGAEGLMIRVPSSVYENKRSKNLLKYKRFIDEEYIIDDVIEGIGNRSGMAGNLSFKLKDGRPFNSSIKGGVQLYTELLRNKSRYIGKTATIRYQELTGDGIPRFPVCVSIDPIDR
jgi:ATP-dependent DNA ligase